MTRSQAFGSLALALGTWGLLWLAAREMGWVDAVLNFVGIFVVVSVMLAGVMLVTGRWVL